MKEVLSKRITLWSDDCLEALAKMPENSLDSCVCDPPYHLLSIVKRFGAEGAAPVKQKGAYGGGFKEANGGTGAAFARMSKGFMGKAWDGGDIAFRPETWAAVYRVLKPGAHLLAFGGTRTYYRMAVAIEDAGFDIRDTIMWLYGTGFPKSHDVSKGIDRSKGAERKTVGGRKIAIDRWTAEGRRRLANGESGSYELPIEASSTDEAKQWEGWGTALKPAVEPIILARKPLSEKTVAANVLKWGTGALNIDGCRVGTEQTVTLRNGNSGGNGAYGRDERVFTRQNPPGRWPANVIHDGSDEVTNAFPDSGPAKAGGMAGWQKGGYVGGKYEPIARTGYDDNGGSASRFFYCAKASKKERVNSKHPTVKPVKLMQYLVRLVTPKGGTVLDPFSGTGTTGEAAYLEGASAVLIEREKEYQEDIRRRVSSLDRPRLKEVDSDRPKLNKESSWWRALHAD